MKICFSMAAFKILPLSLAFDSLIKRYLGVGLFKFILEFVELLGCCRLMFSSNLGSLLPLCLQILFLPPHFSCWDSYYMYAGILDGVPQTLRGSTYCSSLFFFSFCSSDNIISIYLQVC